MRELWVAVAGCGPCGLATALLLARRGHEVTLATSHPEGATTNAQAQADNVPLEIDGACCFNYAQKR